MHFCSNSQSMSQQVDELAIDELSLPEFLSVEIRKALRRLDKVRKLSYCDSNFDSKFAPFLRILNGRSFECGSYRVFVDQCQQLRFELRKNIPLENTAKYKFQWFSDNGKNTLRLVAVGPYQSSCDLSCKNIPSENVTEHKQQIASRCESETKRYYSNRSKVLFD